MTELTVARHGHTTVITIDRPEHRNALNAALRADLTAAFSEFDQDASQRVAVLTGAGDEAFCSGGDLQEMASDSGLGTELPVAETPDMFGLGSCEKITIAAVNGLAVGGGLELSACCDIRLAAADSWFALYEVRHGIIAGVAANVLPRLMPLGTAMDLLVGGARLTADEALRVGFVQQVVSRDRLIDAALAKAEVIAAQSPTAVRGTKQVVRLWRDLLLAEQFRYYQTVVQRAFLTGDVHDGTRAFAEKRPPRFSDGWPDAGAIRSTGS